MPSHKLALLALAVSHVNSALSLFLVSRQDLPPQRNWSDPQSACANLDFDDPVAVQQFWEESPIPGIFAQFLENDISPTNQDCVNKMANLTEPGTGNPETGDCSLINGVCNPPNNCQELAARGDGAFYWILQAMIGFHSKVDVLSSYLTNAVIDDTLLIPQMVQDFSEPKNDLDLGILAGILSSAAFFMVSAGAGIAIEGVTAVAASTAEYIAAEAKAGVAAAEAEVARVGTVEFTEQARITAAQALNSAQARLSAITKENGNTVLDTAKTGLGSTSAAAVLLGSVFNIVNAGNSLQSGNNQVSQAGLSDLLESLFTSATSQLQSMAALAAGAASGADGTDPYAALSGITGSAGPVYMNNSIATFFSDGKWLLSGPNSDANFNATVNAAYGLFRLKLVDYSLQAGGFSVISLYYGSSNCNETYGAQWVPDDKSNGGGNCLSLFRKEGNNPNNLCGQFVDVTSTPGNQTCGFTTPPNNIFDELQNTYGMNMYDYYSIAWDCAVSGNAAQGPDLNNLPTSVSLPQCYFNPTVYNATDPDYLPPDGPDDETTQE